MSLPKLTSVGLSSETRASKRARRGERSGSPDASAPGCRLILVPRSRALPCPAGLEGPTLCPAQGGGWR